MQPLKIGRRKTSPRGGGMDKHTEQALALANRQPGPKGGPWALEHIEGCAVTSDACSGGLSWFYKLFMKQNISCHWCCICHDFLYSIGGSGADRKAADKLLRECAARAGKFEGWRGVFRRAWRWVRSLVMYAAVRVAGRQYWG